LLSLGGGLLRRETSMSRQLFIGLVLAVFSGATQAQTKMACIGASICAGANSSARYSDLLNKLLGNTYQVTNEGVSGACMLKKADSPYWNTTKLSDIANLKPAIVTIELGGNDAKPGNWAHKADFGPDMIAMVNTLERISPKPKVYVCLTIPSSKMNGAWGYGIDGDVITKEQIPLMKHVIDSLGYRFIDLHTPLMGLASHFSDGVHPDAVVHDTIAHVIFRAMTAPTTGLTLAPGEGNRHVSLGMPAEAGGILPAAGWADLLGRSLAPAGSAGQGRAVRLAAGAYILVSPEP